MTRHLTIVIGLVLFGGCATMGDVLDAKSAGRGTERVYPVSADRAWDIARTGLSMGRRGGYRGAPRRGLHADDPRAAHLCRGLGLASRA
jgi:hypothetical protein